MSLKNLMQDTIPQVISPDRRIQIIGNEEYMRIIFARPGYSSLWKAGDSVSIKGTGSGSHSSGFIFPADVDASIQENQTVWDNIYQQIAQEYAFDECFGAWVNYNPNSWEIIYETYDHTVISVTTYNTGGTTYIDYP